MSDEHKHDWHYFNQGFNVIDLTTAYYEFVCDLCGETKKVPIKPQSGSKGDK